MNFIISIGTYIIPECGQNENINKWIIGKKSGKPFNVHYENIEITLEVDF